MAEAAGAERRGDQPADVVVPGVVLHVEQHAGCEPRRKVLDERAATIYRTTLLGSWTVAGPFTLTGSYSADYQLGDIRRSLFRDDRVLRLSPP